MKLPRQVRSQVKLGNEEQNYEQAASLRDQITNLETQLKS